MISGQLLPFRLTFSRFLPRVLFLQGLDSFNGNICICDWLYWNLITVHGAYAMFVLYRWILVDIKIMPRISGGTVLYMVAGVDASLFDNGCIIVMVS